MGSLLQQVHILPNGGLNNGVEALLIGDRESPDCLNVRFRKQGVRKREGTSRYINAQLSGANAVTGIAQFLKSDGTSHQLAFANNDVFAEISGAWVSKKGAVTLTAGADRLFQFASLGDLLIATNDTDQIIKWAGGTGNVAALTGSPPSAARAVATFFNYVFFLNTVEAAVRRPGRLRWSDLNNPESYTAANFADIINLGGQTGLALVQLGENLYAVFDRSIHRISYTGNDLAPFTITTPSPDVGAVSGNAIIPVRGGFFFLSEEGPCIFDGSEVKYIGKRVEGSWALRNSARARYCVGTHNRRFTEVKLSFATGSSTQNDTTLVYDYVSDKWSPDTGYAPNCYATFPSSLPLDPVFGSYDGYVKNTNVAVYADDGAAINAYANTKPNTFGLDGRLTKVRKVHMVADSDPLTEAYIQVKTGYDLSPVSAFLNASVAQTGPTFEDDHGTSLFDESEFAIEGQRKIFVRPTGHGEYFQLQIANALLNQGMNVAECVAHVRGDGR